MTTQPPALDSLLYEFPGLAYRCLNDNSWTMQYVSPAARALTGYPAEAFIGPGSIAYSDLVHPDDRDRIRQEIARALERDSAYVLSYRILTADGTTKFVTENGNALRDADGRVVALQGFVTDVTGVRQIQVALDEVTERFEWIAQATNDQIWDWNLRTNQLWHGKNLRHIFDLPSDDVRCGIVCWSDLIHPEDRQWVVDSIHQAIAGMGREWSAEYRLQRSDGTYADVLDRASISRDSHGMAVRLVGGVSDLTERKQSKLHVERLNRALRILKQCNEKLVRAGDENSLLADIRQVIVESGGYQAASVHFAGTESGESMCAIAAALQSGKPVVCPDIASDPRLGDSARRLLELGHRSGAWVPLTHDQETLGVVAIYSRALAPFDCEELQLLQTLADSIAFGIVNLRSREERRRIESAAVKIAAGVSTTTGDAFFAELARNMALAVEADGAFVAQFQGNALTSVRTVSAVVEGALVPNFDYAIAGSPCERLLATSNCVLNDVSTCFPASDAATMGMQGYAGCRLDSATGQPLGLLFVLFRQPVTQFEFVAQTLQIFAARAGAELERQIADARILEQASLLNKAKDAIVVHDASNRITFWNSAAERLYGLPAEAVLGTHVSTVVYDDAERYREMYGQLFAHNEWRGEVTRRRENGGELALEINSTLVRDGAGQAGSVLSIITDITRRKAAEHEVAKLAFYDGLTGLPNRHFLEEQLQHALGDSAMAGKEGALLWIDLDRLKSLNDTRGHAVGDQLLQHTSKGIAATIGRDATAARFGGDEFVVLLPTLENGRQHAVDVASRLLERMHEPLDLDGHIHMGSASIGLTYFRYGADAAPEILKRADIAMYEAKAAGRNTLRLFDTQMQQAVDMRAELESDLRMALQGDELHLAYQPQVSEAGEVTGVEALLRWRHPRRGNIPPAEFIPIAEASGLIVECGEWVLKQACRQLKQWERHARTRHLSMAVNVSAQQIHHPGFVDQVMAVLRQTGADARKLKLELTESSLVKDTEAAVGKMKALKAIGIGFSLDDFGTGFSSLSYLNRLPLDQLKIDRSFVSDAVTDANAAVITRSVIALGQSLSLEVIAEGVETESQRGFLAAHGCKVYQGYLFSKPLEIDAVEAFITSRRSH